MRTAGLVLVALLLVCVACGDDSPTSTGPVVSGPDLNNKSIPLVGLETALNNRDLNAYAAVLDKNFTFHLWSNDVSHGLPEKWGRAEELTYMSRILDPNFNGQYRVESIDVDIWFPRLLQWTGETHGDEKWYSTTLYNEFEFNTNPNVYISPGGSRVRFVVRNVSTEEHPVWKIVEWWDLGAEAALSAASLSSVNVVTWGQVKSQYGE